MQLKELEKLVIHSLEEHKAEDIVTIDISESQIAEKMIICSGTSSRHVNAIGDYLVEDAKKAGERPLGVEEAPDGSWTLVDLNDIIVHVMLPKTRDHYQLEKLWATDLVLKSREQSE